MMYIICMYIHYICENNSNYIFNIKVLAKVNTDNVFDAPPTFYLVQTTSER